MRTIMKAKVTKDNTLVAIYKDENGDTITHEGKNLVTSDLLDAFRDLIPHIAILCEQKEAGEEGIDTLPESIYTVLEVSGYSIGGSDDNEGVTLTGKRFLQSKKVLNLNAPFTMFSNENETYEYAFELEQAILACEYEVKEYLFNKKWKVVQQELPFEEDTLEVAADAVPDTPLNDMTFEQELQKLANDSSVTVEVNGKRIKPRKNKKLAS